MTDRSAPDNVESGAVPPAPISPAPAASSPTPAKKAGAVMDEATVVAQVGRLKTRVIIQTWVIAFLGLVLTLLLPFTQPINLYYARNSNSKVMPLVGLDVPNMTNRAILSWATTSITEVMTMGFGDIDVRLPKQRPRFTKKGWDAYIKVFLLQKIGETFKQYQLVLTTVPSNTPVIVNQGVNREATYQWTVQMPVIMTYSTNNNVTRKQRSTVTLTIVRVPAEENSFGIAIQSWEVN